MKIKFLASSCYIGVLVLRVPRSACPHLLVAHEDHQNTKQVHSVTVMTHVIAVNEDNLAGGLLSLLHRECIRITLAPFLVMLNFVMLNL